MATAVLKEIVTGREISTTKEGTTTIQAGTLIHTMTTTTTTTGTIATIIQEENILMKDTIVTITREITIKEEITTIILGTILIIAIATIQAGRATINVILILDMKSMSTGDIVIVPIALNTLALVGTFYTSILIHHQDSIMSPAVPISSAKFIARWRKNSVAQRDGRNSIIWTFSRTPPTCARDPLRRAIDHI